MVNSCYKSDSGAPCLFPTIIVFADILVFKREILSSANTKEANKKLRRFYKAIHYAYGRIIKEEDSDGLWIIRTFTDNIIIARPLINLELNAEPDLGTVVFLISLFQAEMALRGYFLRGGLTIGDLYIDDKVLYGPALVKAYLIEKRAKFPRIVASDVILDLIKYQLRTYSSVSVSPHFFEYVVDSDDCVFLNYMNLFVNEYTDTLDPRWISDHKNVIQKALDHWEEKDMKIYSKYIWIANYHNYIRRRDGTLDTNYDIVIQTKRSFRSIEARFGDRVY